MSKKLSPEHEVIAAHMAATTSAFQVLVLCLQRQGALSPGEFPDALRNYMEMAKDTASPMTLAMLDDIRQSLMP